MSASCDDFEFHTTHRCHSVFSCFAPAASFQERLVARENVATRFPPDVDRTSGSFPRFPISMTLLRLRLTYSSWREGPLCLAAYSVIRPNGTSNRFHAHRTNSRQRLAHEVELFPHQRSERRF